MAVPFSDEASLRWSLIGFEFLIGIALVYNSKNQPFPAKCSFWLACYPLDISGPYRPSSSQTDDGFAHFVMLSGVGGFGLVAGVYQLAQTQRDVLVAPYAGLMFCVGVVGLMVQTWEDLSTLEQWAAFDNCGSRGGKRGSFSEAC